MKYLKYFESKSEFDKVSEDIFNALVELEDMGFIIGINDYGSLSKDEHIFKEAGIEFTKSERSTLYEIQIYKDDNKYFNVKDTIDPIYSLVSYMKDKYDYAEYNLKYAEDLYEYNDIDIKEYIEDGMADWIGQETNKMVLDLYLL